MNKFVNQSKQLLSFALILLALSGCGGQSPRSSTQQAGADQNLEFLLKQAQQAEPGKRSPLLVQAAGLLVRESRFEKAQELLIRVNQQLLNDRQMDDFRLYYGETLLALSAGEASLNQLLSVSNLSAKPLQWQIRYSQSLSESYLSNGNYFEAAKLRIALDDLIDNAAVLAENNERIWYALNQMETEFLKQIINDFNSHRVNGWLEIVYLNKRWGYHPSKLLAEIEQWKKRFPLHPSLINQPEPMQRAAATAPYSPKQIGILLPLSGKNAQVGNLIHDGIIAAHYQSKNSQTAPQIRFYDTAHTLSVITPMQQALDEGADFILGPLTKDQIESVLNQESLATPLLALNRLTEQQYNHPQAFQFGLPVEDEAIQSAHRAFEKGYRKAIAFLPDNGLGERAQTAFQTYFEQLGGELIEVQKYKDASSLQTDVQHLLGVAESKSRKKALQQLLGRNLEFEPRRRQDADFIFLVATPSMGRRIKPFVNFYYAHDLPVITTASIYTGKPNPKKDIDLNGIEFPYMPMLISEQVEYQETREQLQKVIPEALGVGGKFFALGFDGYNIIPELPVLRAFPEYRWNGLTGQLGIDTQGWVHRYLTWAQFNRGLPFVTKERELRQLESRIPNLQPSSPLALPSTVSAMPRPE